MRDVWFTSDLHLNHELLRKIRNIDTIDEMNERIITAYNERVKPQDIVYILGDFAFNVQKSQLHKTTKLFNGEKNLILGNHDKLTINHAGDHGFNWIKHYDEVTCGEYRFILFHYPILSWHWIQNPKVMHLFGHVHGNMDEALIPYKSMDVGVDTREDLAPYHIDEVIEILSKKKQFSYKD